MGREKRVASVREVKKKKLKNEPLRKYKCILCMYIIIINIFFFKNVQRSRHCARQFVYTRAYARGSAPSQDR